jgi:hypothetical protein
MLTFQIPDFTKLVDLVLSDENQKVFMGVVGFRRILSLKNPPI